MLELLLGPPPAPHGALMLREMCDPTEAMPIIVAEFIEPQTREMEQLVARLMPDVDRETVSQIVFSIIGQVLFYRFTMPMTLLLRRQPKYPRGFARKTARHIARFSLHAHRRHRRRSTGARARAPLSGAVDALGVAGGRACCRSSCSRRAAPSRC